MLKTHNSILILLFSSIQHFHFGKTIKPTRCYEQYCAKGQDSGNWSCMFSKNRIRNCSSNSVCLEDAIEETGKYCEETGERNGTICYCKLSLCNNQFKSPTQFKVGVEEYHEAAEQAKIHIKS